MGKSSSSGPDFVDVEMMMRAMESAHSGHVDLKLVPLGTRLGGGVTITLTMNFDVLPGSSLPPTVSSVSTFPCGTCEGFWDHVFAGLYTLDFQVGETYENSELWKE